MGRWGPCGALSRVRAFLRKAKGLRAEVHTADMSGFIGRGRELHLNARPSGRDCGTVHVAPIHPTHGCSKLKQADGGSNRIRPENRSSSSAALHLAKLAGFFIFIGRGGKLHLWVCWNILNQLFLIKQAVGVSKVGIMKLKKSAVGRLEVATGHM